MTDLVTGEVFSEGEYAVGAESACEVDSFRVCLGEQRMFLIEWEKDGEVSYNHYLLGSAPFRFEQYLEWLKLLDAKIYTPMGRHEW